MSENSPSSITDAAFDDKVLNRDGVTVVDFWAPWCGPCHTMAPALEAFAVANNGSVTVFKLDVDDNPKTAERYEIRSVPTVIFFKAGEPVYTSRGAMSGSSLQERLDAIMKE
jgi:thioredoxin 1